MNSAIFLFLYLSLSCVRRTYPFDRRRGGSLNHPSHFGTLWPPWCKNWLQILFGFFLNMYKHNCKRMKQIPICWYLVQTEGVLWLNCWLLAIFLLINQLCSWMNQTILLTFMILIFEEFVSATRKESSFLKNSQLQRVSSWHDVYLCDTCRV